MRFMIQVVSEADVKIDDAVVGQIGKGLLVLVGIGRDDDRTIADQMIRKLLGLRIFEDENGKTNLSLSDVNGELLVISQFTLYADCRKGNRPSFYYAGEPETAEGLYEYILTELKKQIPVVERGVFGAYMKVSLTNEGPFTIILDSEDLAKPRR